MKKIEYKKLRELRLKKGYSCQKMADMLHICKAYYWQIEHCNRRVSYNLAVLIAEIFGLRPDDIFYDETK